MTRKTLVTGAIILAAFLATLTTIASRNLRKTAPAEPGAPASNSAAPATPAPTKNPATPETSNADGALTTRYPAKNPEYIEAVFTASKKSLDQLGYFRTGETPAKDKVTIFARAHGDVKITVDIEKKPAEAKEDAGLEWIYVSVRHGVGDDGKSRAIVSKISENLKN